MKVCILNNFINKISVLRTEFIVIFGFILIGSIKSPIFIMSIYIIKYNVTFYVFNVIILFSF